MNDPATQVLKILHERRSVRAYTGEVPAKAALDEILSAAARAPSGNNIQPWQVHVLRDSAKRSLTSAIMAQRSSETAEPTPEYNYYPESWPEPYLGRRRTVGWALLEAAGVVKGDRAGSRAWHDWNFDFFGAPVGLIFTIDRRLGVGAFIDLGMFLQGLIVAARALGMDACPQAAFAHYHEVIRRALRLPDEQLVVCGMSLGFADTASPVNNFPTERAALDEFVFTHS